VKSKFTILNIILFLFVIQLLFPPWIRIRERIFGEQTLTLRYNSGRYFIFDSPTTNIEKPTIEFQNNIDYVQWTIQLLGTLAVYTAVSINKASKIKNELQI